MITRDMISTLKALPFVLAIVLFVLPIKSAGIVISVDSSKGNDGPACLSGNGPRPCRTLDYACNHGLVDSGSKVIMASGLQLITENIVVKNLANISLIGQGKDATIVNCSSFGTGVQFVNMKSLTISGVTFENCGALQNSTIASNDSSTVLFRSAVYILNSTMFNITDTAFNWSIGNGLSLFDTSGHTLIQNVSFSNNLVPAYERQDYSGGGGLYIELSGCTPGIVDPSRNCNPKSNLHSIVNNTFAITECHFQNNQATSPNQLSYLNKNGPVLNCLGCGGGLHISLRGMSSGNNFSVEHCTFLNNYAIFGGGIAISVEDESADNTFYISIVRIESNKALKGGGGVNFGVFNAAVLRKNSFLFINCEFLLNQAKFGGGAQYFSIRSAYSLDSKSEIRFTNCRWVYNTASVGAAVALTPEQWQILSDGYLPSPRFHSCTFIGNSLLSFSSPSEDIHYSTQEILGGGILFSDTVSITLSGYSHFTANRGSSIHISAAAINILDNSVVEFADNIAHHGGAISLMGYSYLIAHENATVLFMRNRALDNGGAILYYSVDVLDYLNSHRCFIKYAKLLPVELWKANFTFINNTADTYGHSIYATSLEPCARFSATNESTKLNSSSVFHWKVFHFIPSLAKEHVITTDPARIAVKNSSIQSAPGITYRLPITITDDLEQEVKSALLATTNCNNTFDESYYVTDKTVMLNGDINSTITVSLETSAGSRPIGTNITLNFIECPPGYHLIDRTCRCIASNKTNGLSSLPGLVSCDEKLKRAYLLEGYWAGCLYGTIITTECPLGYCHYQGDQVNGMLLLPSSCSELEEAICSGGNREGKICGECANNYTVYYHSDRYKCGECPFADYGILFYVLSELLPLTILFIFVVMFDVSLTSGAVNSFIFFAQTLDFYERNVHTMYTLPKWLQVFSRGYWFLFGFLNLDFFRLDVFSFCLWKDAKLLDVLVFKYITTFYGLVLIGLLFLLIKFCHFDVLIRKCRKSNFEGYTVTNGLTAFLIISYSQCAKVSFQILTHVRLNSLNRSDDASVVFLSGNTPFFGSEHLYYAFPALIVAICTVVLPLTLTLHPLYHLCRKYFIANRMLHDSVLLDRSVTGSLVKDCSSKFNLYSKPILDSLQGCYKDNTRFFAGLMFLYRLLISVAFAFTTSVFTTYATLELIIGFILTIHGIFQPYRKKWHNVLDSLMFANLALINGITLYNSIAAQGMHALDSKYNLEILVVIQTFLVYAPVLVFAFLLLKELISFLKRFCRSGKLHLAATYYPLNEESEEFDADHLPARMFNEEPRQQYTERDSFTVQVKNGVAINHRLRPVPNNAYGSFATM